MRYFPADSEVRLGLGCASHHGVNAVAASTTSACSGLIGPRSRAAAPSGCARGLGCGGHVGSGLHVWTRTLRRIPGFAAVGCCRPGSVLGLGDGVPHSPLGTRSEHTWGPPAFSTFDSVQHLPPASPFLRGGSLGTGPGRRDPWKVAGTGALPQVGRLRLGPQAGPQDSGAPACPVQTWLAGRGHLPGQRDVQRHCCWGQGT